MSSLQVSPNKKGNGHNNLYDPSIIDGPLTRSEDKARRSSKTFLIQPAAKDDVNKALDGF